VVVCHELATRCGIPVCYLSKILQTLRDAGLVEAVRGLHGGYRLQQDPAEIHIADVVGLFREEQLSPRCLLGEGEFAGDLVCSAHSRFRKIYAAYTDFLENTTIEQIAKKKLTKRTKKNSD
jgi:Rrf2 family protein